MKTKCDEIGFVHAWEDITENLVYATYPASYPNKKRRCMNCGREEELVTTQVEDREWQVLK